MFTDHFFPWQPEISNLCIKPKIAVMLNTISSKWCRHFHYDKLRMVKIFSVTASKCAISLLSTKETYSLVTSLWSEKKETYSGTHWLIQQNIGWFNIPVYNWRNCLKKEITKNKEVSESVIYGSRRFPLGQTWFRNWVPAKMYFVGERYFMLISRILGTEDRVVFN